MKSVAKNKEQFERTIYEINGKIIINQIKLNQIHMKGLINQNWVQNI